MLVAYLWRHVISDSDTHAAAEYIHRVATERGLPTKFHTAVVLGSGLGAVGRHAVAEGGVAVEYEAIPDMPQPAVTGHAGRLVMGTGELHGVLLFQGRVHYYEGHPLDSITFAVRMATGLGIGRLIVTNAAGGISEEFQPGDLMLLDGHSTFLTVQEHCSNVEILPNESRLWNRKLRETALQIQTPLNVHSGVYAMMSGPNYETPAEVKMLAKLGVSAVGMSTVPEAIAAAARGVDVLGISCITNVASGLSDAPLDHAEVSKTASSVEAEFTTWMLKLLEVA